LTNFVNKGIVDWKAIWRGEEGREVEDREEREIEMDSHWYRLIKRVQPRFYLSIIPKLLSEPLEN